MVLLLQVLILLAAILYRRHWLLGHFLKVEDKEKPQILGYVKKSKKGKLLGRKMGLAGPNAIHFVITREQWHHRFLKGLGLATEVEVHQPDFDGTYFITTDFPDQLEHALLTQGLFQHIKDLFDLPVDALHVTPTKIWCNIKQDCLSNYPSIYTLTSPLKVMEAISRTLNTKIDPLSLSSPLIHARQTPTRWLAFGALCCHAGVFLLGILGYFTPYADNIVILAPQHLLMMGLGMGSLLACSWLAVLLFVFHRTSWIAWVLADFVLCGLIGFILSGGVIARDLNIHLAQPAPTTFALPLLKKTTILHCTESCGRRCQRRSQHIVPPEKMTSSENRARFLDRIKFDDSICRAQSHFSFQITVAHWGHGPSFSYAPKPSFFDSVREGDLLSLPLQQGALGSEWIDTNAITKADLTY